MRWRCERVRRGVYAVVHRRVSGPARVPAHPLRERSGVGRLGVRPQVHSREQRERMSRGLELRAAHPSGYGQAPKRLYPELSIQLSCRFVPIPGVEPGPPCEDTDLNRARLPIPPDRLESGAAIYPTDRGACNDLSTGRALDGFLRNRSVSEPGSALGSAAGGGRRRAARPATPPVKVSGRRSGRTRSSDRHSPALRPCRCSPHRRSN